MQLKDPSIHPTTFIAPTATVVGDVKLDQDTSVWYGAVLRGDTDQIIIGKKTNIQDNAVVHCDPGDPVHIGESCIIGHSAIVHGAHLKNNVLVGMGAIVLNNAKVGEFSIIGANALVTAGTEIPPYSLVLGSPAKVVKTVSEDQKTMIINNADEYAKKAQVFKKHHKKTPH